MGKKNGGQMTCSDLFDCYDDSLIARRAPHDSALSGLTPPTGKFLSNYRRGLTRFRSSRVRIGTPVSRKRTMMEVLPREPIVPSGRVMKMRVADDLADDI
jgi:hypothetical protein